MKNVLLASASRTFLKRNTNLLVKRGFQLFTSNSGKEALNLHADHLFDLILSDLKLEDMGGCTLCSLVQKEDKLRHVPVILICHNISGSIERVEQSGADAMLLKPVDPILLIETVGSFIDLKIGRSKRVDLKVKVFSKKEQLPFFCLSHDISNTGILLETEHYLELGSRIICQFVLPASLKVEAEGEVIRCISNLECESLYGIKFIELPLPYRRAIDNYVSLVTYTEVNTHNMNKSPLFF